MAKSLSKGASTEATAKAEMPPRVLVEMPDGDLTLGEDTGKLAVCEAAEKVKLAQMSAAEGGARTQGSQRYARMMAAQYSLTLQRLLSRRARLFAGPVGIDIGAMLWPILCVACGSLGGVDFAMPLWLVVTICCSAIALNVVLLTCALTKRWGALHALTWVHVATYFALWALRFELNLWVFTRLLVGLHSCWILAVNCELQSVLSQQQLRFSPWLDRVRTLWLGRTTATDRRLYDDSIAQALNDEAPLPEAAGEAVPAERTASVPISAEPVSEGSSFQLPMPPLAPRRSAELQVAAADAVVTVHVQRGTGAPCEEGRPEGAGDRQN